MFVHSKKILPILWGGLKGEPKLLCTTKTVLPPTKIGFFATVSAGPDYIEGETKTELHKKLVRDNKIQSTSANMTNWWVMFITTQLLPFTPGDVSEERAN